MKKFYSIIALASMMLTSVLSFTSCQKDELPTPQKTQSAQVRQSSINTVSQTTTTASDTVSYSTAVTGSSTTASGSQFKVKDTSFVLGTWKANIGGTECKLVVSSSRPTDLKYFDEYNATLYVGDQTIVGIFSATHLAYIGEFHTDNGKSMSRLYNCAFDENNLTEFTAENVIIGCNNVANQVRFIKQ